jgi:hypothetical protein
MLIQPKSIGQLNPSARPTTTPIIPKIKGIIINLLSELTDSVLISVLFTISKSPSELILEPQPLQN